MKETAEPTKPANHRSLKMSSSVYLIFSIVLISAASTIATDHIVGANKGWNPGMNYTLWANNHTFYVGDLICKNPLSVFFSVVICIIMCYLLDLFQWFVDYVKRSWEPTFRFYLIFPFLGQRFYLFKFISDKKGKKKIELKYFISCCVSTQLKFLYSSLALILTLALCFCFSKFFSVGSLFLY